MFASRSLLQFLVLDYKLEKLASTRKLHHQVQILIRFNDLVDLNDVWMVELLEYFYLTTDSLYVFLILNLRLFEYLDGHLYSTNIS